MRKVLSAIVMCTSLLGGLQAKEATPIRVEENAKRNTNSTLTNLHELNYQGWIASTKDTTGAGITGTMEMIFRLYSEPTGGTELWNETQNNIQVDNGLFNAVLGSVKPIPASIFTGTSLWLETQVGSDILSPRKKLASVGYAIKAEKATHSDTADYARTVINAGEYNAFGTKDGHMGESWTGGGTLGLSKALSENTSSTIYCEKDEASNSGTGTTYGGYLVGKGSGTGYKYGSYNRAEGVYGSNNYAVGSYGSGYHAGGGIAYGAIGSADQEGTGDAMGGYFAGWGSGSSGKRYGAYCEATSFHSDNGYAVYGNADHSSTGSAYGGYFEGKGSGSGYKYGSYSKGWGPSGTSNPAYGAVGAATHAGSGSSYGGYFLAQGSNTKNKYGTYSYVEGSGNQYGLYSTVNSSTDSSIYAVYGIANHTGAGSVYGSYFYLYGAGTGTRYGSYLNVYGGDDNTAYGSYVTVENNDAGASIGTRNYAHGEGGENYGSYNSAYSPENSGAAYGCYNSASHDGTTGYAYGGYFTAAGPSAGTAIGVCATATDGYYQWAGYFDGDVQITGDLYGGKGSFLIDHPLYPTKKTLTHNFVASPENLCLYRGKVKLNANGEATVEMPSYFASLTKENEATVNLTSIGKPFQVGYEWQSGNTKFTAYGEANREVSYVVLADRDDPVMKELQRPIEEDKKEGKICKEGKLIYPKAYGYPETMGKYYEIQQERLKQNEKVKNEK